MILRNLTIFILFLGGLLHGAPAWAETPGFIRLGAWEGAGAYLALIAAGLGLIGCYHFVYSWFHRKSHSQLDEVSRQLRIQKKALGRLGQIRQGVLSYSKKEIQSPLSALLGTAERLIGEHQASLEPDLRKDLDQMYYGSLRLSALVSDILDFSQVEEELKLHPKPLDLWFQVETALLQVKPWAQESKSILRNLIPKSFPLLFADPLRLLQILLNFIGYGIQYLESSQVQISAEQKADRIWLEIDFQGRCIPAAVVDRLLKHQSMPEDEEDSCLGIWIAKMLIEEHGGSLKLVLDEGSGSRVLFDLPMVM